MPAIKLNSPKLHSATNKSEPPINIATSRLSAPGFAKIGVTKHAAPKINQTLAMFEPTILPIARPAEPPKAASKLTTNSGADVPKATTVMPITIGEMPIFSARIAAPRTIASAATKRTMKPPMTCRYIIMIFLSLALHCSIWFKGSNNSLVDCAFKGDNQRRHSF